MTADAALGIAANSNCCSCRQGVLSLRDLDVAQPWPDFLKDATHIQRALDHPFEIIWLAMALDPAAEDLVHSHEHVSRDADFTMLSRRGPHSERNASVLSYVLPRIAEVALPIEKTSCPRAREARIVRSVRVLMSDQSRVIARLARSEALVLIRNAIDSDLRLNALHGSEPWPHQSESDLRSDATSSHPLLHLTLIPQRDRPHAEHRALELN
ncbi:MAG: hypothetical protein E6J27_03415 [Chloroflexi bacterium]|nr:MAG: hypothetical protein E6J27_03415 [Chloroflexota bacterium]